MVQYCSGVGANNCVVALVVFAYAMSVVLLPLWLSFPLWGCSLQLRKCFRVGGNIVCGGACLCHFRFMVTTLAVRPTLGCSWQCVIAFPLEPTLSGLCLLMQSVFCLLPRWQSVPAGDVNDNA